MARDIISKVQDTDLNVEIEICRGQRGCISFVASEKGDDGKLAPLFTGLVDGDGLHWTVANGEFLRAVKPLDLPKAAAILQKAWDTGRNTLADAT